MDLAAAGVGDEHVDRSKFVLGLVDELDWTVRVGEVGAERDRPATSGCDLVGQVLGDLSLGAVGERHGGALGGERERDRLADPAACAGYERDPSPQRAVGGHLTHISRVPPSMTWPRSKPCEASPVIRTWG